MTRMLRVLMRWQLDADPVERRRFNRKSKEGDKAKIGHGSIREEVRALMQRKMRFTRSVRYQLGSEAQKEKKLMMTDREREWSIRENCKEEHQTAGGGESGCAK